LRDAAQRSAPQRTAGHLRALLAGRLTRLYQEAGKFGAVGVVALAIELSLFNAALFAGLDAMLAQVISTVVAATAAFAGNRYWTWRHRPRTGLRREYLLYFFFNAIGLLIGLACLYASRDILGQVWPAVFRTVLADNLAAKGVGMALATLFRFWAYRRWVFPETAPASAEVHIPLPELPRLEVDTALGVANSTVGAGQ
jgi:putative flippase GtrA